MWHYTCIYIIEYHVSVLSDSTVNIHSTAGIWYTKWIKWFKEECTVQVWGDSVWGDYNMICIWICWGYKFIPINSMLVYILLKETKMHKYSRRQYMQTHPITLKYSMSYIAKCLNVTSAKKSCCPDSHCLAIIPEIHSCSGVLLCSVMFCSHFVVAPSLSKTV